jgi:hypothetical protein
MSSDVITGSEMPSISVDFRRKSQNASSVVQWLIIIHFYFTSSAWIGFISIPSGLFSNTP